MSQEERRSGLVGGVVQLFWFSIVILELSVNRVGQ